MKKRKIPQPVYPYSGWFDLPIEIRQMKGLWFSLEEKEVEQAITEWLEKHHRETFPEDVHVARMLFSHRHPDDDENHRHLDSCEEVRLEVYNKGYDKIMQRYEEERNK